jgi:hypothetical protein
MAVIRWDDTEYPGATEREIYPKEEIVMAEVETGPAPTVALGEQLAAGETVSGVGAPHRPGYMESSSYLHKLTAEQGVPPPEQIKFSEE